MIRIEVGREVLDLFSDTKMEWIRVNPLFVEEVDFAADFTYNFTIPRSRQNTRILRGKAVFSGSRIYVNGQLFARCVLHKLRSDDDTIEISCVADMGQAKETMIQEMDLPEWEFSWDLVDDANAGKMPFVFPWVRTEDEENEALLNFQSLTATEPYCINQQMGPRNLITRGYDVLCPFFRLKFTIDSLITALNNFRTIHNNSIDFDDCIFNNNLILQEGGNVFFIHTRSLSGYNRTRGLVEIKFPKLVNNFDPDEPEKPFFYQRDFRVNIDDVISFPIAFGLAPNFGYYDIEYTVVAADINANGSLNQVNFANNLRAQIMTYNVNLQVAINYNNDIYLVLTILDCYDITSAYRSPFYIVGKDYNYTYKNISLKNHLPNRSAFEILNVFRKYYNLVFTPDYMSSTVYVMSKNTLLNSSDYKDYTDKLLEYGHTLNEPEVKIDFLYPREEKDALSKTIKIVYNQNGDFSDITELNVEANVPLTELRSQSDGVTNQNVNILKTHLKFEPIEINKQDFLIQFCRFIGEVSLNNAEKIISAETLELSPENMFRKEWFSWYTSFATGREIRVVPMQLNANDIQGLNPELKWMINQEMFLWKEIRTPITMQHGIEPSEVKLVKVNYSVGCETGILQIEEIENEEEGE